VKNSRSRAEKYGSVVQMSEQPERSAALKLGKVEQLSHEELVLIVLTQQKLIDKLQAELEKLKDRQPTNSKTSSKPPSSDLIQKSETAPVESSKASETEPKSKPGGQPGHLGKTRKGFGRVDRLVWLGNYGHISYEKQQEFLREIGGIEIGIGTLQATNARVAEAVKTAVEDLWKWAPLQAHVHVDETPWCVKGIKEWLWTATGQNFCLFHAADTRSRSELETMLGSEFAGVLSSDDFSVYNGVEVGAQQKCLAHLRRHFKKVLLLGHGNNTVVAKAFLDLIDEAFRQHRKWRSHPEEIDYSAWARDFKTRLAALLNTWLSSGGSCCWTVTAFVA
jgi:Transposase IS66 family/Family of unknown function (DUF6444)